MIEALQWIANFFGDGPSGITLLLSKFYAWAIQKLTVFYIGMQIEAMKFAWLVAQNILNDLQVTSKIVSALNLLPQQVRETLNFFKIPECLTNVITAYVTRFVMRFIP